MSARMNDFSSGSVAAVTSALTMGVIGETSLLDNIPKGGLVLISSALISVVLYFVRRDASRYAFRFTRVEDAIEALAKTNVTADQLRHELAILSSEIRTLDRRTTVNETQISTIKEKLK